MPEAERFETIRELREFAETVAHKELERALETLQNAIRKIDKETRTRFEDTFNRINTGLKEKFPRLFGGGHAYLELVGEQELRTRSLCSGTAKIASVVDGVNGTGPLSAIFACRPPVF